MFAAVANIIRKVMIVLGTFLVIYGTLFSIGFCQEGRIIAHGSQEILTSKVPQTKIVNGKPEYIFRLISSSTSRVSFTCAKNTVRKMLRNT